MGPDSTSVAGPMSGSTRLVKGCPCFKEFGKEKVCLNNDDIIPIVSIAVDPMFLGDAATVEDLANLKSDNESMCYLLIFLDAEGEKTYCISQGQKIRINEQDVKASEILAALQFVTTAEQASDGIVCSSCLYKYLVTLGDTFDDVLTETERSELISAFVRDITAQMAIELIGSEEITDPEVIDELVSSSISQLLTTRITWASVLHDLKAESEDNKQLIELISRYRQLARFETIFLFQVSTLRESDDKQVSMGLLRFMIDVAERIIRVIGIIRDSSHSLSDTSVVPDYIQALLDDQVENRNRTEKWFTNLVKLLNTIEIRTAQKSS
ncbi:MAG: hypothetical protein ACW96N_05405 [Candidatus Thorarchaeota archaeon]|jgi:hypothetical protein